MKRDGLAPTVLLACAGLAGPAHADSLSAGAPASNLSLSTWLDGLGQVTDFRFLPDGRTVIIQKTGEVIVRLTDGTLVDAFAFPVDTGSEKGLLGVEVHPDFATEKTLFFYYSLAGSAGGSSTDKHRVVSKILADDSTLGAAETVLVKNLRGPANHDGGSLAISADGQFLYIGVGDTGCNSGRNPEPPYTPTNFFATCLSNGNGKILRVALDGSIPSDNPLAAVALDTACGSSCGDDIAGTGTTAPRTDLWAWGLRNPWRTWVDPVTGNLWVGDVGEVTWEEITIVQGGRHHGWPWREGFHGWPLAKCRDVTPDTGDCVEPIYNCKHGGGTATEDGGCTSITGGLIVDSCTWPAAFRGKYVFADNSNGNAWTLDVNPARDGVDKTSRAAFAHFDDGPAGPVAIHLGPDGDLYVAVLAGRIVRISPLAPEVCPGTDPAVDAPADAPVDAPIDAPVDPPVDAAIDPPIDAPPPVDPPADASPPIDPPVDAGKEPGFESPGDAGTDKTDGGDASADRTDGGDTPAGSDARDAAPDGRPDTGGQPDAGKPGGGSGGCSCDAGSTPGAPLGGASIVLLGLGLVLGLTPCRRRRG